MQPGSSGRKRSARQHLADAIAAVRRRRAHADAEALLDECLSLLDELHDRWPVAERAGQSRMVRGLVTAVDGDSPAMARLKQEMRCIARDPYVSVLIRGESGTGKERVARAIHDWSSRAGGPFIVVNCAGLAPTLAEDELFGHVRGAFTGAAVDRPSPFESADGGTVFLDEIGELTVEAQTKLLRALQERTVHRLGGTREIRFDARIIAATNADLEGAQRRGRFRQDLYYRLQVFELVVPPLRSRGNADLHQLVEAILGSLSAQRGRATPTVAADVWDSFTRHAWPGNVRELHNALERMIVAAGDAEVLTTAHLPPDLRRATRTARMCNVGLLGATLAGAAALPSVAEARSALQQHRGRYGRTAAALGISRHQLYRLLKREALVQPDAVA